RVVLADLEFEIVPGLVDTDQRGSHPNGDVLVRAGVEAHVAGGVGAVADPTRPPAGDHRPVEGGVHEHPRRTGRQPASYVGEAGDGARGGIDGPPPLVWEFVEDG